MYALGYSRDSVFQRSFATLKRYNDSCYKVVLMKSCRLPGFEEIGIIKTGKRNSAGNTKKLEASLSRTKSRVTELALCNPWEYFVTLTLSPEKYNRNDLPTFKKNLSKFLNNLRFRYGWAIKYLLIPEQHKDGAWHMHGLFMGIPKSELTLFSLHDHLPMRVLRMLGEGRQIMNWKRYAESFGYVTCEPIRNLEATAKYITKYITKDLVSSQVGLNKKLYLCSQGLNRAETICRGHIVNDFQPDFCNDYVAIKTFKTEEEALALFVDDNEGHSFPISFDDIFQRFSNGGTNWTTYPQT